MKIYDDFFKKMLSFYRLNLCLKFHPIGIKKPGHQDLILC
jgi:hypothetical protein